MDAPARPSTGFQFEGLLYRMKRWSVLAVAHGICLSVAAACLFP